MDASFLQSLPFKGMDLSSSAKYPFALQNSMTNDSAIGRSNAPSQSRPFDTNQRMMLRLNQEKVSDSRNIMDEENERCADEYEEDNDRNEDSEKGALSQLTNRPSFGGVEGPSNPYPQTLG